MSRFAWYALLFAAGTSIGCGGKSDAPKTAKVTGVVTYKGEPVTGATVTFANDKSPRAGSGVTNSTGAFSISTYGIDDGAIVGEHSVTVTKQAASTAQTATMKPEDYAKAMQGTGAGPTAVVPPGGAQKNELPTKYSNSSTSPLKATVEAGKANQFKFELVD